MLNHASLDTEEPFVMDNGSFSFVPYFMDPEEKRKYLLSPLKSVREGLKV